MSQSQILVPEIMHKARKGQQIIKRPAWMKPQSAERIERILVAHRASEQGFKTFAVGVVLAGMELAILRKEAGAGHWADILTGYLQPAGISEKHVERYIEIAHETARKHRVEASLLLESPNDVEADVWEKLTSHVTASTNASTWRALIEGMGMAKRETRGGYRPDPSLVMRFAAERNVEADFDSWDAPTKLAFKDWARALASRKSGSPDERALKRAAQNWLPTIGMLQTACDPNASWLILPKEDRQRFAGLCRRLADQIEASL